MPNSAGDQGAVCTIASIGGIVIAPFGGGPFQTASVYQVVQDGMVNGAGKLPVNPNSGYAGYDLWIGGGDASGGNANGGSIYAQLGLNQGSGTAGSFNIVSTSGSNILTFTNGGNLSAITDLTIGTGTFLQSNELAFGSGGFISWCTGNVGTSRTLQLFQDASDTLAQRRSTNAQTFRVYNTYTDASNYERLGVTWSGNVCTISTAAAGTGTARALVLSNVSQINSIANTVTTSQPVLNLSQTWNAAGVTFAAATIAITDTASASDSTYFSITRNGSAWFNIQKGTIAAWVDYPYMSFGTQAYRGAVWFVNGGIGISRLNAGAQAAVYLGADITNGTTGSVCVGANSGSGLKGKIGFTASDPFQAEPDIFLSRLAAGVFGVNRSTTVGGSLGCINSTTNISANTDNLALDSSRFQRMNCTSACNLTGVAPPSGTSHVDGREIDIINVGTQNLTFKHNVTSTAANRFFSSTGADLVCAPNQRIRALYDSTGADNATQAGWRIWLTT